MEFKAYSQHMQESPEFKKMMSELRRDHMYNRATLENDSFLINDLSQTIKEIAENAVQKEQPKSHVGRGKAVMTYLY